jgi:hypothetical protein
MIVIIISLTVFVPGWTSPQEETAVYILPVVVNSSFGTNVNYVTWINLITSSGPSEIHWEGFNNTGGKLNVWCSTSPISSLWTGGPPEGSGWKGYSYLDICDAFDPILDNGWIRATVYDAGSIQLAATIRHGDLNNIPWNISNFLSVPAVTPQKGFLVPITKRVVNNQPRLFTSYAIINPANEETAEIILDASSEDSPESSSKDCTRTIILPPLHRISRFINELLPTCDSRSTVMKITSNTPIAVATLEVYLPEYKFISLPVEILPSND